MKASRSAQRAKILELLINAHGEWVPLSKIRDCACQYNARIFELRRLGFRITNRMQEVNGSKHSWFRLESGPQAVQTPFQELGDLAEESQGDD